MYLLHSYSSRIGSESQGNSSKYTRLSVPRFTQSESTVNSLGLYIFKLFSQIIVVHEQNIAENQCSNHSSLISYSHGQFLLLCEGLNKKEKCKRQESSKLQFLKFSWVNSGRTGTSKPQRQPDIIIYKPLTSFPSRHSTWERRVQTLI